MKYSFEIFSPKITINLIDEIVFNKLRVSLINFYEQQDNNYNMLVNIHPFNNNTFMTDTGKRIKYTSQLALSGNAGNQIIYQNNNNSDWDFESQKQQRIMALDLEIYINGSLFHSQINNNSGLLIEITFL